MTQTKLVPAYLIGNGHLTDYLCPSCALGFANENDLKWNSADTDWTIEDPNGNYAYEVASYMGHESDYPTTCGTCGVYLGNVRLTKYGRAEMTDHADEYPEWVLEEYEIDLVARRLARTRTALSGLHARLNDMSRAEYNGILHAIWLIDQELDKN